MPEVASSYRLVRRSWACCTGLNRCVIDVQPLSTGDNVVLAIR